MRRLTCADVDSLDRSEHAAATPLGNARSEDSAEPRVLAPDAASCAQQKLAPRAASPVAERDALASNEPVQRVDADVGLDLDRSKPAGDRIAGPRGANETE